MEGIQAIQAALKGWIGMVSQDVDPPGCPPFPTSQMRRFLDATSGRSDWQGAKGLVFEPFSLKLLSAGGAFGITFVGGQPAQPCDDVHGVSLEPIAGSAGMWALTLTQAPISAFGRSSGVASGADSLAAAIAQIDWSGPPSPVFLYPSWHEFPAIDAVRLPNLLFQVRGHVHSEAEGTEIVASIISARPLDRRLLNLIKI